ncbi:17750_t:CDS:2, partial [Dentiscutata erythropus]
MSHKRFMKYLPATNKEKKLRNTHEIRNYFHKNTLKTRLICNICKANYPFDTNLSNIKKYFAKYYKKEYNLAISKNEKRKKQIKEINQIQRKENSNNLTRQNNETSIIQTTPILAQIENFIEDDYITEEKIEEDIISRKTLPVVQNKEEKIIKKQKINTIKLDAKDSIINFNIQDEISFHIVGK